MSRYLRRKDVQAQLDRLNGRLFELEIERVNNLPFGEPEPDSAWVAGEDLAHLTKVLKVLNERPGNQLVPTDIPLTDSISFSFVDAIGEYRIQAAH